MLRETIRLPREAPPAVELLGRSILAYFSRREDAERAQTHLRRAGFDTVQLDRLSPAGPGGSDRPHNPLTGRMAGLAELTGAAGDEGGPLLAADPDASGLAHELEEGPVPGQPAWLLTVVTSEDHVNRAVHILEEAGGVV